MNPFKRAQAVKYSKPAAQLLRNGIIGMVTPKTSPGITSSGAGQTVSEKFKKL